MPGIKVLEKSKQRDAVSFLKCRWQCRAYKVLKTKATRRRQLFKRRWQCRTKTKSSLINRRDAVSFCYYGYFKALHVNETKIRLFSFILFNQISNFSLT
jgi:hypothetical protein